MYRYKLYEAATEAAEGKESVKKVIAISTFAGKAVRGIAKCDPRDEYSFEFGRSLAIARCDAKISEKRVRAAKAKMEAAAKALEEAQKKLEKMTRYYEDSVQKHNEADETVYNLLNNVAP